MAYEVHRKLWPFCFLNDHKILSVDRRVICLSYAISYLISVIFNVTRSRFKSHSTPFCPHSKQYRRPLADKVFVSSVVFLICTGMRSKWAEVTVCRQMDLFHQMFVICPTEHSVAHGTQGLNSNNRIRARSFITRLVPEANVEMYFFLMQPLYYSDNY